MQRAGFRWLLALALLVAAAAAFWWHHSTGIDAGDAATGSVAVGGGDGGGLPVAEAAAEGFEPQPLAIAQAWAAAQHARALLIARRGHLVSAQYYAIDADTLVDGGELNDTLMQLAAGIAAAQNGLVVPPATQLGAAPLSAAIARASGRSYAQFLSRNIWQPLNAAPAQWSPTGMRARGIDWLRVAELLLHDGRFEGTQVVPSGWVQRLPGPQAAVGAEPFADGTMYRLRGRGATRLWLSPRFQLAILCVADASQAPALAADETRLPNMVIRALRDRPGASGTGLNDLVPGH
jgi:hypothetical protein